MPGPVVAERFTISTRPLWFTGLALGLPWRCVRGGGERTRALAMACRSHIDLALRAMVMATGHPPPSMVRKPTAGLWVITRLGRRPGDARGIFMLLVMQRPPVGPTGHQPKPP